MSDLFSNSAFNGDISRWDVSQTLNMAGMFAGSAFNKDISKWDVRNVRYMGRMFARALFDQDISDWNISQVNSMREMFMSSQFTKAELLNKWNDKIKEECDTYNMFKRTPEIDGYGKPITLPDFYKQ